MKMQKLILLECLRKPIGLPADQIIQKIVPCFDRFDDSDVDQIEVDKEQKTISINEKGGQR